MLTNLNFFIFLHGWRNIFCWDVSWWKQKAMCLAEQLINVSKILFSSYLIFRYQQKKIHTSHIAFGLVNSKKRNLDRYHSVTLANYVGPVSPSAKGLVLAQFGFRKTNRLFRFGCHISWLSSHILRKFNYSRLLLWHNGDVNRSACATWNLLY